MKDKGFILIDSFFSFSIVILLVISLTPIISLIQKERYTLSEKMKVASLLHDELQEVIFDKDSSLPLKGTILLEGKNIYIQFLKDEHPFIKGCAKWTNKANREDEICFYANLK